MKPLDAFTPPDPLAGCAGGRKPVALLLLSTGAIASDIYLSLPPPPPGDWQNGDVFIEGFDRAGNPWGYCEYAAGYGRSGHFVWYRCGFELTGASTYVAPYAGFPKLSYGSFVHFTSPAGYPTYGWLQATSPAGNMLYLTDTYPYRESVLMVR